MGTCQSSCCREMYWQYSQQSPQDPLLCSTDILQVPYYEYALDMILDNEPPADVMLTDQQHEMLENAAEMLYGLIHARYCVTARGLTAMLEKYKNCDFGRCPRCDAPCTTCLQKIAAAACAALLLTIIIEDGSCCSRQSAGSNQLTPVLAGGAPVSHVLMPARPVMCFESHQYVANRH